MSKLELEEKAVDDCDEENKSKSSVRLERKAFHGSDQNLRTIDIGLLDKSVDCMILVSGNQEFQVAKLKCCLTHRATFNHLWYNYGTLAGKVIVLVQYSEAGNFHAGKCQERIEKALEVWKPRFVFAVGVAIGLSSEKQKLGDVLLSRAILPFKRVDDAKSTLGSESRLELMSDQAMALFNGVSTSQRENSFRVMTGAILSCADEEEEHGKKQWNETAHGKEATHYGIPLVGADVGGLGMINACKKYGNLPCVVIKGVCAFTQGNMLRSEEDIKVKAAVEAAAGNAFEFLVHALTMNWPHDCQRSFLKSNEAIAVGPNHELYPELHQLLKKKRELEAWHRSEEYSQELRRLKETYKKAKLTYEEGLSKLQAREDHLKKLCSPLTAIWHSHFHTSLIAVHDDKHQEVGKIQAKEKRQTISWSKKAVSRFVSERVLQEMEEKLRPSPKITLLVKPKSG